MVNNSTQSNKPPAQTIEHKNTTIYGVEIQILAWDRHTHVAGLICNNMLSALAKYVINRLIHGLFHISLVIIPRLISSIGLKP
jgi:hypothetical protein